MRSAKRRPSTDMPRRRAGEVEAQLSVSGSELLGAGILIAVEQRDDLLALQGTLQEAGYTAIAATTSPLEARALHGAKRFDLIVLDVQTPGTHWAQLWDELTQVEGDDEPLLLAVATAPARRRHALTAGARDCIGKPFDPAQVQARVRNALEVRVLYKKLATFNVVLEQMVQLRTAQFKESEARFRALTELSADWYWEQDEHGQFTKMAGPVLEMLGLESAAVATAGHGPRWNEAELAALYANLSARRPFIDLIYSRTHADGSTQYFEISGEPMFSPSCRFTGYRGVGRDVTEGMRPGEALQRFRSAMDGADAALFLLNRVTKRFADVNPAACQLLGYTRDEFSSVDSAAPTAEHAHLQSLFATLVADTAGCAAHVAELCRKDGTSVWAEVQRRAHRACDSWIIVDVRAVPAS